MKTQVFTDIVTDELKQNAIINDEYTGFMQDYLVLHCLIKKYKPATFFELGTNMGTGTNIICNAIPQAKVYSLDLPPDQAHISLQSPASEGKGAHKIGSRCTFPFTQILCNSLEYDYSQTPCEGYFIDGEHTYVNALHESKAVFKLKPSIVIWHDSDIPEVWQAIDKVFGIQKNCNAKNCAHKIYDLIRVVDTRIAYAILK